MPNSASTWSSISRCCAVTHTVVRSASAARAQRRDDRRHLDGLGARAEDDEDVLHARDRLTGRAARRRDARRRSTARMPLREARHAREADLARVSAASAERLPFSQTTIELPVERRGCVSAAWPSRRPRGRASAPGIVPSATSFGSRTSRNTQPSSASKRRARRRAARSRGSASSRRGRTPGTSSPAGATPGDGRRYRAAVSGCLRNSPRPAAPTPAGAPLISDPLASGIPLRVPVSRPPPRRPLGLHLKPPPDSRVESSFEASALRRRSLRDRARRAAACGRGRLDHGARVRIGCERVRRCSRARRPG